MKKLVLIDGNAIMHRAFHALPKLASKDKKPINAVYGLVSMLLRIIQNLEPNYVAVCFDRKEPTFRHEEYKEYQAHRPEMDEDLSPQFEKAKEVLSAMRIPVYEKAGFEADDVIGTIAKKASENDFSEVDIVTGDKDILQLVTDKVKVFLPIRGLSQGKLFGKKEVKEKMGVDPEQVDEYKALVGDPSDNYPGVRGIGPKTAEKLFKKYKTVDEVYKNLDKIDKPTREKLKKYEEDAYMSYKLAKIVTDVEIKPDFDEMNDWQVDSPELFKLFEKFGFKTLRKRTEKVGKEIAERRAKENQNSLF